MTICQGRINSFTVDQTKLHSVP